MRQHRLATAGFLALDIPVVVLFVLWTATGLLTLLAGTAAASDPALSQMRRVAVDVSRITIGPSEALARAALDSPPADARLLTVLERPAYRFGDTTIFADSGERLATVEQDTTRAVAARFAGVGLDSVGPIEVVDSPDRWTTGQARWLPLHRFRIDDDEGTEVYVSPQIADIVAVTSAHQRRLAWIGDLPHRLGFAPLAVRPGLKVAIVTGLCALMCVGAIAGAVRLLSDPRRRTAVRTVTILIVTSVTVLWAASGWLLTVAEAPSSGGVVLPQYALSGRPVDARALVVIDLQRLPLATGDRPIREIEFLRIQDAPFLIVTLAASNNGDDGGDAGRRSVGRASDRLLIVAETMTARRVPFTSDSIRTRLAVSLPDVPIDGIEMLDASDGYYSPDTRDSALPVTRVRFGDPSATWVYVDPSTSAIVDRASRSDRIRSWAGALHRLDVRRLSRLLRSLSTATP